MAIIKGAIPWWSLPYNWIIGAANSVLALLFPDADGPVGQLRLAILWEACSSAPFLLNVRGLLPFFEL